MRNQTWKNRAVSTLIAGLVATGLMGGPAVATSGAVESAVSPMATCTVDPRPPYASGGDIYFRAYHQNCGYVVVLLKWAKPLGTTEMARSSGPFSGAALNMGECDWGIPRNRNLFTRIEGSVNKSSALRTFTSSTSSCLL